MALLCIPVPGLVSCTFSTIPICPILIQRFFSFTCLHSFFTCKLHVHAPLWTISATLSELYLLVLKYTSKKGPELMRLLTVEL